MFSGIPSASLILSSSESWFTAFFGDWIYLIYVVVGITASVTIIRFLINIFGYFFHRLKEGPYERAREDALFKIERMRILDKDYKIWQRSQGYLK